MMFLEYLGSAEQWRLVNKAFRQNKKVQPRVLAKLLVIISYAKCNCFVKMITFATKKIF